jgi:uncharacterized SAM-binding protein YcdF (DUF218 family)
MYFSKDKWPQFKKLGRKIGYSASMAYQQGWNSFLFFLIPSLILFPLGGILFGRFLWWWLERKHASPIMGE